MSDLNAAVWAALAIANFNAAGMALTRQVSGSWAVVQWFLFSLNILAGIFSVFQALQ